MADQETPLPFETLICESSTGDPREWISAALIVLRRSNLYIHTYTV